MTNLKKLLCMGILGITTLFPTITTNASHKPKLEELLKQVERCDKWDADIFDYFEFQELCRQNKKLYSELADINHPGGSIVITGDIIKEFKKRFRFEGETLEYSVVLFDESLEYKDAKEKVGLAWWSDRTKTAFIDNTELTRVAEELWKFGYMKDMYDDEFTSFMANELYNAIKKDVNSKEGFIKKFKKVTIKSTINHEPLHHFDPYSSDNAESRRNEAETFLYQISKDEEYNGWVFWITTNNQGDNEYGRFYKLFENRGYTKERLMELKPKERSKIAKEILKKVF
ncbi:hypothetical protein J4427_02550 [Candidatus Woesearchaeota archaeon]|nr:hypothetical protein [Candidatus Woesearchaeota archaeon]